VICDVINRHDFNFKAFMDKVIGKFQFRKNILYLCTRKVFAFRHYKKLGDS